MPNAWTDHLHKWATEHKVSYMCALTDPKAKEGYVPVKVAKRNARLAKKAEKEAEKKKPKEPSKVAVKESKEPSKEPSKVAVKESKEPSKEPSMEKKATEAFKEEQRRIKEEELPKMKTNIEEIYQIANKMKKWDYKKFEKETKKFVLFDPTLFEDEPETLKDDDAREEIFLSYHTLIYKLNKDLTELYIKSKGFKDVADYVKQTGVNKDDLEDKVGRIKFLPMIKEVLGFNYDGFGEKK